MFYYCNYEEEAWSLAKNQAQSVFNMTFLLAFSV